MKFLVLFACVAVASAQPVSHPNGAVTPVQTPEVAAATAAHLAAKGFPYAGAYAGYPYGGLYGAYGYNGLYNGAYGYGYAGYAGWAGYPYAPALVGHPNGAVVPAEPADVVAARADHLAAHA